jgi:hypothetical protein
MVYEVQSAVNRSESIAASVSTSASSSSSASPSSTSQRYSTEAASTPSSSSSSELADHHGREIDVPYTSAAEQMAAIRAALAAEYGMEANDFVTNDDTNQCIEVARGDSTKIPNRTNAKSENRINDQAGGMNERGRNMETTELLLPDDVNDIPVSNTQADDEVEYEILYKDVSSLSLFRAIEDGEWRRALSILHDNDDEIPHRLEEHRDVGLVKTFSSIEYNSLHAVDEIVIIPSAQQLRTWVRSTGTVQTTFEWALWRRLPIHEACRRQPPAWLIAQMISAFPASARRITQFGELPLHLAVECGAAPEVVNLLLTAYFQGNVQADKSGRTPLQILRDTPDLLGYEDHRVVYESLARAEQSYREICQVFEKQHRQLQDQHMAGLAAIHHQHDVDLQLEQHQQSILLEEVERLSVALKASQGESAQRLMRSNQLAADKEKCENEIEALRESVTMLEDTKLRYGQHIEVLEKDLERKEAGLKGALEIIECLQEDLKATTLFQSKLVKQQMAMTELHLQKMVESYLQVHDLAHQHAAQLRDLCMLRGISFSSSRKKQANPTSKQEVMDGTETPDTSVDTSLTSNDEANESLIDMTFADSSTNVNDTSVDEEPVEAADVVSATMAAAWRSIQIGVSTRKV